MKTVEQKYVRITRSMIGNLWILGPSGMDSYLASQCQGNSGLEKDLDNKWIIKYCWEDSYQIVFLLERDL